MSSSLGIYFGPKVITLVETKGRKVVNDIQIKRSVLSSGEIEEKVPDEVKIVALFKEELRKSQIEAKDATISLSGKELIMRSFEIPLLPANEIPSAVNFEAKKYIPFKVEDLFSDFQVQVDKTSRRNQVLYTGIKKEVLDKYISIMNQLNLKINTLEYSAFSTLRFLKLINIANKGIAAVITMDLAEQDEVNFTILENGFPLFSRDITLSEEVNEFLPEETLNPTVMMEKLKSEIRVSLDYYQRKFGSKKINRVFFIANEEYRSEIETLFKEIALPAQYINIGRYLGKHQFFSLGFVKSYGASLFNIIKTNLKLNILASKAKAKAQKEAVVEQIELAALLRGLKISPVFLIIGVFMCIVTLVFGIYNQIPVHKEIRDVLLVRPQVQGILPEASYEELVAINEDYKKKLNTTDNLVNKQLYLTEVMDVIPRLLPNDARLINFNFSNKGDDDKGELRLQGIVYLGDSDKELKIVNSFLATLKENTIIKKYFRNVSLQNIDHRQFDKANVTVFVFSFKN